MTKKFLLDLQHDGAATGILIEGGKLDLREAIAKHLFERIEISVATTAKNLGPYARNTTHLRAEVTILTKKQVEDMYKTLSTLAAVLPENQATILRQLYHDLTTT